jgi:hypothetical protein
MADDQPNAIVSLGTPGVLSDPPSVRLVAAQGAVMKAMFMQLVELVIVCGATWLAHEKTITPELWAGVCLYGGAGNLVNKVRGFASPSSTTAMVAAFGPAIAKGGAAATAAKHLLMLALAFVFAGCNIGNTPPPTLPPIEDPVFDAGASSASCKAVCASVDGTSKHCTDLWTGAKSCSSGCAALVASGAPSSHLRACWVKATTCTTAYACKENP